ncbi:MAG: hypothetical protein MJK18_14710 [Bdellovibrionales bacterium]|nr:hypothetical protein [Bdellovibrionales bacterium]
MDGSENHTEGTQGLPLDELEGLFEDTFNKLAEASKDISENKAQNTLLNTPLFDPNSDLKNEEILEDPKPKSKTSLRMKYEAEVQAFTKRQGNLEDIRRELGLSKRKMAQLLLVDPSAWTRWTKNEASAPPHVYRALEWYMLLQEKHPEYKSSLWLNAVSTPQLSKKEIENIKTELIDQTQGELTKKALFYLKEEDYKRQRLSESLGDKIGDVEKLKKLILALIISQLLMAVAFITYFLL